MMPEGFCQGGRDPGGQLGGDQEKGEQSWDLEGAMDQKPGGINR